MRRGRSSVGTGFVGLAAFLMLPFLSFVLAGPSAASLATQTLAANEVKTADLPLPNVVTPADGRLRGQQFVAMVTGVAWPASVTVGGLPTVPLSGDRLVAFTLRLAEPGTLAWSGSSATGAALALDVNGNQLSVPMTGITEQIRDQSAGEESAVGSGTYVVAVPDKDHDVDLVVTQASFTQRFDLWTLQRLPPAPTILYRDPTTASVNSSVRGSAPITITNPATGFVTHAKVSLNAATLSYFAPGESGTSPAKPTEAFLSVKMMATYTEAVDGSNFLGGSPMPGSQLTFTPTGGAAVPATMAAKADAGRQGADDGLLNAYYWFTVPAGTTSGTLAITAGPVTGTEYKLYVPTGTTPLTLTEASIPVAFPNPLPALSAQKKPSWIGAPVPTSGTAGTTRNVASALGAATTTSGGGGFPIWLAVVLVLVAAAVLVGAERLVRRRRLVEATAGTGAGTPAPSYSAPPTAAPATPSPPPPEHHGPPPVAAEPRPLGGPGDLVVRVLGPVEVTGWDAPAERRTGLEALCAYLALHADRPVGSDQLLTALWPADTEGGDTTRKTLRNNLSRLRQAVGPDHLPDAVTSGGYRLVSCVTDWDRFRALVAEATTAGTAEAGPVEADALRAEALALVRGAPFAGAAGNQYGWALDGSLVYEMTVAVVNCAHALATGCLSAGDAAGATAAARSGLQVSRTEAVLWQDLFAAVRRSENEGTFRQVWNDARRALGRELADRLAEEARSAGVGPGGDGPDHRGSATT